MTDSDYDNIVIENCFCEFSEKMLNEIDYELENSQKERLSRENEKLKTMIMNLLKSLENI